MPPPTVRRAPLFALVLVAAPLAAQAPADTLDLFVVAGQSNARGSGGAPEAAPLPPPGAAFWARLIHPHSGDPDWVDLLPVDGSRSLDGSAWPAFAKTYHERTGRRVLLLQTARSSTANAASADEGPGHWSALHAGPGARGGPGLLALALAELDGVLAAYDGPPLRLAGVLWVQGETDARAVDAGTLTREGYRDELHATVAAFRTALADRVRPPRAAPEGGLPFYLVQIGHHGTGDTRGFQTVRRVQYDSAREGRYTLACSEAATFPEDGLLVDNVHWNQQALDHVGTHVGIVAARDTPPPTPATATEAGPLAGAPVPYPNPAAPRQRVRGLAPGAAVVDVLGRRVARADARGEVAAPLVPGLYLAAGARLVVR